MTAGAKSFGSFFSGVANKAGARIKETVKDNVSLHSYMSIESRLVTIRCSQSILGAFNKEQEAFIKDQSGKGGDAGVCPWVGHGLNEDKIKEEILSLSGVSLSESMLLCRTFYVLTFLLCLGSSKFRSRSTSRNRF